MGRVPTGDVAMPLFSRRRSAPKETLPPAEPIGEQDQKKRDALKDGPLLAEWFMQYRLEQEIERALRYERPLAILRARPELLSGERITKAQRIIVAEAALEAARSTDLVGWAESGESILIVLPDTDPDMARVAAARWQAEMWRRGRRSGVPKWEIRLMHDPDAFRPALGLVAPDLGERAEDAA
jgi:hypothetical protein